MTRERSARWMSVTAAVVGAGLIQRAASAQDAAPSGAAEPSAAAQGGAAPEKWWLWGDAHPSEWTLQITARAWYMALGGDNTVQGGSFDVRDVNADDPEMTPAGEARIRAGKLSFSLSGFGYFGDVTAGARSAFTVGGVAVAPGQVVNTSIDITSAELSAGYRVWSWKPNEEERAAGAAAAEDGLIPPDVEFRIDLYGGARFVNISTDLTTGGATVSDDGYTLHPLIGARFGVEMFEKFSIDITLDGGWMPGGTRNATAFNVAAGISWRPWGNVGVEFGYRMLRLDMEDGSQAFDGSMAGIFGSVVLRF